MNAWLEEVKTVHERTGANLRERKAEIRANDKKFEVLQCTLVSRMDIRQAETDAIQEEVEAETDSHHEKLKAKIKAGLDKIEAMVEPLKYGLSRGNDRRAWNTSRE
jgi:hypothetical protein